MVSVVQGNQVGASAIGAQTKGQGPWLGPRPPQPRPASDGGLLQRHSFRGEPRNEFEMRTVVERPPVAAPDKFPLGPILEASPHPLSHRNGELVLPTSNPVDHPNEVDGVRPAIGLPKMLRIQRLRLPLRDEFLLSLEGTPPFDDEIRPGEILPQAEDGLPQSGMNRRETLTRRGIVVEEAIFNQDHQNAPTCKSVPRGVVSR